MSLIELEGECVALEAEFAPARTVKKDALSRLPVAAAAVVARRADHPSVHSHLPATVEVKMPPSTSVPLLEACQTLEFQQVTRSNGSVAWSWRSERDRSATWLTCY